ncbi:leucine--tRNA ligase [Patescibacteria group bacterium]|nr:leucine--tRNA ligase [Patescibacteria group bacterium]
MKKYFPTEIEPKWQKKWEEEKMYRADDKSDKPKFYTLIEFPYPSGAGLHVGHTRSWSAMDAYSRKKRMEGKNVLYPMGWDAFGLPAENYAIKMKIHPKTVVAENILNFKRQIKSLGMSFDWSREIDTTDPHYYKWTQWIFLKFFEKGLAYQADVPVNWCPFCKTNLADEEVLADGTHERCGTLTEKRMQKQWLLAITKYADRLLEDLRKVDYPNKIRVQQENWIGKSQGIEINFKLKESDIEVAVFTTRPDTIYGTTGLVLAPEHPLVLQILSEKLKIKYENLKEIREYVERSKKKSEIERTSLDKAKTGVSTGLFVINPVSNDEIPLWVGDYVLGWYGKGAVMLVPGHDKRDYEFAKKFDLEIREVIKGGDVKKQPYEGDGVLINSGEFNGQSSKEAAKNITKYIEEHHFGKTMVQYKIRDWVFSRQHYWGEPIPMIHCEKCGTQPVLEKDLPVELPYLEKYEPSGTGESPLSVVSQWVNVKCPKCQGKAKRETDTMPNWAGSNWYYLAYLFASKLKNPNQENIFEENQDVIKHWMPVDVYQGGFEHTTLHLLYSRFVYKFLYDQKIVPNPEPYAKRRVHGIVLGPDGRKMSKSFGNVINPDDIVKVYGADTLRIYEMFMGPFDQTIAWNDNGVEGCFRFLKRIWQLSQSNVSETATSRTLSASLNQTIKKVGQDLEDFKFNTAVAAMMQFINDWQGDEKGLSKADLIRFLAILAPFAPHISEEIYQSFSKNSEFHSIHMEEWPEFDSRLLVKDEVVIVVQVNGKVRENLLIPSSELKNQSYVEEKARKSDKVKAYLDARQVRKVVYIEGKIINFVI